MTALLYVVHNAWNEDKMKSRAKESRGVPSWSNDFHSKRVYMCYKKF
jgi:hypothetical protein